MGRKRGASSNGNINKSEEIRKELAANPRRKVKEIVEALAGRGVKVTPAFVYMIKSKYRKGKRRIARAAAIASGKAAGMKNPVELVIEVKRLAVSAGGMKNLKMLLDALSD